MANQNRAADDLPLPGEIGDLKQALEVRRKLMDNGRLREARKWMRQWYKEHRGE